MITEPYLELGPAYGRDYKNAADVRSDWNAGKDFQMLSLFPGGTYCSKKDFAQGTHVILRYAKLTKTTSVQA